MNLLLQPMRKKLFQGAVAIYDPYRDIAGKNILPVNADNFVTGWAAYGSASAGVYKRNILPANADDFAVTHGWSAQNGCTVTVVSGYPDPDGGNNAYRIVITGTASNYRFVCIAGLSALLGPAYSHQVQVKSLNGKPVKLGDNRGGASLGYTDDQWHTLKVENTVYSSTAALNFWLLAVNENDSLDFLAYQPMLNAGETCDTYVPPQTGYPDPDGGSGAYRIITVGGSSTLKYVNTVSAVAGPHQCVKSVWAKEAVGSNNVFVSTEGDVFWADITTNWNKVVNNTATDSAGTGLRFVTSAAANSTDFYVYHPMINFGADAARYVVPSGLPVSLTDFSGKKNLAQLGSTAVADTNDPAWAANALVFGGDDFVLCGRPAALEAARPFCIYGVVYINSSTNSESPIAKNSAGGSGTGNKGFLLVKDNVNPGAMGFAVFDTSGTLNYLWSDGTVATGWHYFFIGWDGAKKYLKIDGAMKSSNQATYAADNTVSLYLGRYAHNTTGYFTGREAIVIPCSKFHSPAEEQRNYNYLKRLLAARGIAI